MVESSEMQPGCTKVAEDNQDVSLLAGGQEDVCKSSYFIPGSRGMRKSTFPD